MHTHIAPAIQADPELHALVTHANGMLRESVEDSRVDPIFASWELGLNGKGQRLLNLTLKDDLGSPPVAVFDPEELRDDWRTKGRILRPWGDLLGIRTRTLVNRMLDWPALDDEA